MSLLFYAEKEDIPKDVSLDNFKGIFIEYRKKNPNLSEALNQMYKSTNISNSKIKALTDDILAKSNEIVDNNFMLIKEKYPNITREEAQIISSYTCIAYEQKYSPFKILNTNLCEENRNKGIENISKYFYIFLKALRKLDRYFPKKYLYKCIDKQVLLKNFGNNKRIIYKRGINKIFWGFTSFTSFIKKSYHIGEKDINIEKGTIFALYGDIWGYDISLFNSMMDEEIILEPEQKCIVINAIPPINNQFINIRLKSENYNKVLNFNEIFQDSNEINEYFKTPQLLKIIYNLPYKSQVKKEPEFINIFGKKFVENNKNKCIIIYKDKEYKLNFLFEISHILGNYLEIYLKGFDKANNLCEMFEGCNCLNTFQYDINTSNIINLSGMFKNCNNLTSIPDISKWKTSNVIDMSYMFYGCSQLIKLPDISKWNTSNVINISYMFYDCINLTKIPDISKWNTSKIINMSYLFYTCSSLITLPDITKWNISNVIDIKYMFYNCYSLSYIPEISTWSILNVKNMMYLFGMCKNLKKLPNISKWNTSNVENMISLFANCSELLSLPDISKWNITKVSKISNIFEHCIKLKTLPDISKWDTKNIHYIDSIFYGCSSLIFLPDISKWDFSKVYIMTSIFNGCSSLEFLPDISKWNTSNVSEMNSVFERCSSLSILPDISKWNISKVKYTSSMFRNCKLIKFLPDISNWNTENIINMNNMFEGCSSLITLPDISKWNTSKVYSISYMFKNCISLSYFPDISKWKNFDIIKKDGIIMDSINCLNN